LAKLEQPRGVAAPLVAPIGLSFVRLVDDAFAMTVHQVTARSNAPTRPFEVGLHLPCEEEAFSKNPLFSTYKRRPLSLLTKQHTSAQEHHKARARASPLHGLRP
jgi:hypothetical protein